MLHRRNFLKAVSLGAANAALLSRHQGAAATSPPSARPNILIVVSDQHRAGLRKGSGYPLDTSPTLDRLADRGIAFERAYVTQPVCAPSRTSLLTGRWPQAHRVRANTEAGKAYFEKDLFDVLKSVGYKTGLSGKNGTYLQPGKLDFYRDYSDLTAWQPPNPSKEIVEFDEWRRLLNFSVYKEATPFPLEVQFPYRAVSSAIEFLQQFGDQSFALELSFPEPHDPEQVPRPYFDMFPPDAVPPRGAGPEALRKKGFQWQWEYELQNHIEPDSDKSWRRYVSNYLGSLRMIDDQLDRLLSYMRKQHLLENTIIVYVADHGDFLTDYGLMRKGVGLPEALARIPMVWSGPGIQRIRNHPAFVSIADVMPTLCEAIGAQIPHGVQGRSLWPLLQGEDYPEEEFRSIYAEAGAGGLYYDSSDHMPFSSAEFKGFGKYTVPDKNKTFNELNSVSQSGFMKMVRMGHWKLLYDMMGYGELYRLDSDPYELNNLFDDPSVAAAQKQLVEELLMWTIRTQDTLPTGEVVPGLTIETKWPKHHNWYSPYRSRTSPKTSVP